MRVAELMREERRQEAEQLLPRIAKEVNQLAGTVPVLYVREGLLREELLKLIDEEPMISIPVPDPPPGSQGPGPLIPPLTAKRIRTLRIHVTIAPRHPTDDTIHGLDN